MPKRKWPAVVGAGLLLAGLLGGALYFSGAASADSYQAMSSLNSSPKGAKLLYDALSGIQPLNVTRNFLPLSQWRPSSTTIFFLGVGPDALNAANAKLLEQLEKISQPDNRLILGITDDELSVKLDPKNPPAVKTRWGLQFVKAGGLQHDASWQEVSGIGDIWEKRFGARGTVIVALHSNELSNEILAGDKSMQALLPPLIGNNASIAFEETHLGFEETGSIAGLTRRYRLQGLAAGLLLLTALFIWNRSVSFPPPSSFESGRQSRMSGAGAHAVFASLIARHLSPQALIESCVAEWNRVRPQQRVAVELQPDPVAAYRKIQEGLRAKRART